MITSAWLSTSKSIATRSHLCDDRDARGDDWADIIDMLTMYPDARRNVARILGEIEAGAT